MDSSSTEPEGGGGGGGDTGGEGGGGGGTPITTPTLSPITLSTSTTSTTSTEPETASATPPSLPAASELHYLLRESGLYPSVDGRTTTGRNGDPRPLHPTGSAINTSTPGPHVRTNPRTAATHRHPQPHRYPPPNSGLPGAPVLSAGVMYYPSSPHTVNLASAASFHHYFVNEPRLRSSASFELSPSALRAPGSTALSFSSQGHFRAPSSFGNASSSGNYRHPSSGSGSHHHGSSNSSSVGPSSSQHPSSSVPSSSNSNSTSSSSSSFSSSSSSNPPPSSSSSANSTTTTTTTTTTTNTTATTTATTTTTTTTTAIATGIAFPIFSSSSTSSSPFSASATTDMTSPNYRYDPLASPDWDSAGPPGPLCARRVKKDLSSIFTEPLPGIFAVPQEDNLFQIHALIVGPFDTPYEGGLFHFVVRFGPHYPLHPPRVRFLTTGGGNVRFNPNLYKNGKVCLSILGTWPGPAWSPASNLSSVLLSLQSILNDKPYFNEPGFDEERNPGDSRRYNTIITHEMIRVSVVQQLNSVNSPNSSSSSSNPLAIGSYPYAAPPPVVPPELIRVMEASFLEYYDHYVEVCTQNQHLDRQPMEDPFGEIRGHFCYGQLLRALHRLKAKLSPALLPSPTPNTEATTDTLTLTSSEDEEEEEEEEEKKGGE